MSEGADETAATGPVVTRTLSPPPRPATPHDSRAWQPRLTRGCDAALDLAVLVLASWTVVYHVCLVLRLGVPWAVGLELLAFASGVVVAWRARGRPECSPRTQRPGPLSATDDGAAAATGASASEGSPTTAGATTTALSTTEARLVTATWATAVAAAVLVAVDATWPLVAALWLAAAGGGTAWAVLRLRRNPLEEPSGRVDGDWPVPDQRTGVVVALAWAAALAALSTVTLWPNPDDLYYVNLSQWVVDHGTFPLRDTIFSDLVFPMSSWPPMASYDALAGTVGRLAGVSAGSVVYMVVPPVVTFLSVLALWRLLRAWRVQAVALALSLSLVFLLFDGGGGYGAPGNLFLIRIWQGKVILLCLMVPILLVSALRYVEKPTGTNARRLFAGGVAAVGLSTTAMFLVPLLALGGAAPLVLRRPARALLGFAAMAAYPVGAAALTVAVGGHSADLFGSRRLYRFDPAWFGHQILRDGPVALIAVTAVLAGALLVPHRAARVTTGVLTAVTGLTFVPGVSRLSYDLVGLGPTLWRVSWVASIAALVGVLGVRAATYPRRRSLRLAAPLALVAALVTFGVPISSERNGVDLAAPPHWQRGPDSTVGAEMAVDAVSPGDLILAPEELAITIDVLTTRVKTVAPRAYFMDYYRGDPAFHYAERLTLVKFANRQLGRADQPAVARALAVRDVDEVCLPVPALARIRFVRSMGYHTVARSSAYTCLTR